MKTMDFEQVSKIIDELPTEQRIALAQKLLGSHSGLTVIFGGNNIVHNSFTMQLNSMVILNNFRMI